MEALREAAEARSEWQAEMYAEDERHFASGSMHGAGVDVCADVVEAWLRERAGRQPE